MRIRLLSIAVLATVSVTGSQAQGIVSASSSAGFDAAQLTNNQSFSSGCYTDWDPVTSTFQTTCEPFPQNAAVQTKFNFREQKASAYASANTPSILHVSASTSSQAPTYDKLRSTSSAAFGEILTFDVPGHQGETVLIFAHYSVQGAALSTKSDSTWSDIASGSAGLNLSFGLNSTYIGGSSSPGYNDGFLDPNQAQSSYRIFAITAGRHQFFSVGLTAACNAQSFSGAVGCSVDATFRFLGISAVALTDGTEIKDFSVRSSSGYDYVNPSAVPEPQTYLMFVLGIGCLVARRRLGRN